MFGLFWFNLEALRVCEYFARVVVQTTVVSASASAQSWKHMK